MNPPVASDVRRRRGDLAGNRDQAVIAFGPGKLQVLLDLAEFLRAVASLYFDQSSERVLTGTHAYHAVGSQRFAVGRLVRHFGARLDRRPVRLACSERPQQTSGQRPNHGEHRQQGCGGPLLCFLLALDACHREQPILVVVVKHRAFFRSHRRIRSLGLGVRQGRCHLSCVL